MLAGPRVMAPRRQLVRILSGLARSRRAIAVTGLALAVLAAGAVFAAWISTPHWWPLPSPYDLFGRLVDLVQRRLRDLR
jgi:fatty acid desaturase